MTAETKRRLVGLALSNEASRRSIEAICLALELEPVAVDEADLKGEKPMSFEVLIADEPVARRMRRHLDELQRSREWIAPALVAVCGREQQLKDQGVGDFDAVLRVPTTAADLEARLSVVLYSQRALAQRYQPALEELNLNRNIFRSVTNGISVADARQRDCPLIYVNPSFELMTGYTMQEVLGKNCRFLQGEEHEQVGLTLVREALREGRQTVAVLRNYRHDGSMFWNELTLSPLRNREGTVTHFVGIQMDVTERVEMEKALRESEKLAAVGRLASSISHEVNNPLEALMNLLYLAQETASRAPENDDSRGFLRQADEELRRVKLITAQSLRFYKQSTKPEAVLANDLVTSVLDMYRARLLNYNIEVAERRRSTQHLVGLGSELRQVLSNLVSNAVDAMKGGGGLLSVRTREATCWRDERQGVMLTIADNGTGMPPKVLANIYQAFYTTKGPGGTGLGLWISSEIVERHKGHLKVRSCDAKGRSYTVFELFLPFRGVAGDAETEPPGQMAQR